MAVYSYEGTSTAVGGLSNKSKQRSMRSTHTEFNRHGGVLDSRLKEGSIRRGFSSITRSRYRDDSDIFPLQKHGLKPRSI